MIGKYKYISKSKLYKNVYILSCTSTCKIMYRGQYFFNEKLKSKLFDNEDAAARWVDIELLKIGMPQKNNTFKKL